MANGRMLKKSISQSEKLSTVSDFAALLYTWTIPHCDDGGNMDANPLVLRGVSVPMRDKSVQDISSAREELIKAGLWVIYSPKQGFGEGKEFLHVNDFERHQTLRGDRPDFRFPPYGYQPVNQRSTSGVLNVTERNITKRNVTELNKSAKAYLEFWNQTMGTHGKSIRALVDNLEYWLQDYTIEDILGAVKVVPRHHFWRDKMTPEIMLRRKNPRQEAVNYIGEMLNYRKPGYIPKTQTVKAVPVVEKPLDPAAAKRGKEFVNKVRTKLSKKYAT